MAPPAVHVASAFSVRTAFPDRNVSCPAMWRLPRKVPSDIDTVLRRASSPRAGPFAEGYLHVGCPDNLNTAAVAIFGHVAGLRRPSTASMDRSEDGRGDNSAATRRRSSGTAAAPITLSARRPPASAGIGCRVSGVADAPQP